MVTAKSQTHAWQRDNQDELLKNADPETGFIEEDTLRDKMKTGEIGEQWGLNKIATQDKKLKAKTKEEAATLLKEDRTQAKLIQAQARDSTAWGQPEEYAQELATDAAGISDKVLQQQTLNAINHQLAAVKKTGETAERPIERKMYQLMNEDRDRNGAMLPVQITDVEGVPESRGPWSFLGAPGSPAATRYEPVPGGLDAIKKETYTDANAEANFGKGMTKDKAIAAINEHASKLQDEMAQWFKSPEGEKATWEQANDHRKAIERPYVMEMVRATLARKAPAAVATKEEFDALPAGAPFVWNGRLGVKN